MAQANLKAVVTAEDRASGVLGGVGSSFGKLTAAVAAGQLAAQAFSRALNVVTDSIKESVGASFQQVRSVENATIALRAYEKNGEKVNGVLKDLIKFARSDTGVLFQREDLFDAAQTLKLYGQETDTLVDKVKILSKGVSLGKTSFQELSSIVGRAAAKGRLDAVDFDMLIERGIGLDKSFRGATVTSEQLFKALDKALPAELLEGRANTIDGMMIRLKSAFRDLGGAILGVDAETTQFIKGGLGDTFLQGLSAMRENLRRVIPHVQKLFRFISGLFKLLKTGDFDGGIFKGIITEDSKVVDVMLNIRKAVGDALNYIKVNSIKFTQALQRAFEFLKPSLEYYWKTIVSDVIPTYKRLWKEVLEPLIPVIGVALVVALKTFIIYVTTAMKVVTKLINVLLTLKTFFFSTLPNAIATAFQFIVEKLTWAKDNFGSMVGYIIGAVATLPVKLPFLLAKAVAGMVKAVLSINWFNVLMAIGRAGERVFKWYVQTAINAFNKIKNLGWGDIFKGIAKGMANSLVGLLEGAINGALSGIPGSPRVNLPRFARGVRNFSGGLAMVGENGPEIVRLPKGSDVLPNHKNSTASTVNITVQAGAYMGNRQDARKYAQMIYENLKDVAQSNGMTVGQMIGQ